MAVLQSEIKRAFLRSLARQAATSTAKLLDTLNAFQDSGIAAVQTGRLLVGTSGGGYSSSFAFPAIGMQFSQDQVVALSEELLMMYNDALITLSAQSINNPTDIQILNTMLADDRMQKVKHYQNDFTVLRWPARY